MIKELSQVTIDSIQDLNSKEFVYLNNHVKFNDNKNQKDDFETKKISDHLTYIGEMRRFKAHGAG